MFWREQQLYLNFYVDLGWSISNSLISTDTVELIVWSNSRR